MISSGVGIEFGQKTTTLTYCFLLSFDRRLLAKLSRCAWKVLSLYLKQTVPYDDAVAGTVIAVQSFGDFLGFNSHLHVIATDGCFYGNGSFKACPKPNPKDLEGLFRYEVFKMLKSEGKINDLVIENMMNWRHSGFKSQLVLSATGNATAIYLESNKICDIITK
jgi:hypothetical protein